MSNQNDFEGYDLPNVQRIHPDVNADRPRRRSRRGRVSKALRRLRKRVKWQYVAIGISVIVIVISLVLAVMITDSVTRLNSSWESLNRTLAGINNRSGTELTLTDVERLQTGIKELSRHIQSTRSRTAYISPIVNFNNDWKASLIILDSARLLVDSSADMIDGIYPTLNFLVQGESQAEVTTRISSGERIVELLELGQGRFASAKSKLQSAETKLDEIDLRNLSSETILQIEQLRGYHEQLLDINTTLVGSPQILTTMMGLDGGRSYLILAQNNDEIRPSGGYIGTYGWFIVEGGRIIDFDYSPTTASSPNPPRTAFLESFALPEWWIQYGEPIYAAWDGSWYADFPSTAELAMSYYNAGGNPQSPVDGVLAIDITGFELMLGALGDVPVEEYGVIVNRQNFRKLVYDIRATGQGVAPHKQFMATLYRSIFEEWQSLESDKTADLLQAMLEGLQSKHIMFYFAEAEVNNAIAQLGWTGSQLPATEHDYILVADTNLGNKSNNSIDRSLTYDVNIHDDGSVASRLSVNYDYFALVAENDPAIDEEYHGPLNYGNLMQVFLPLNTVVTNGTNLGVVTRIRLDSHLLLVARTQVAYDSSERYQLVYEIPDLIEDIGNYQHYRLLIQKQAGARAQSVNVQVTLPQTASVISSSPKIDASYNLDQPILEYRLNLDSDQWIEIIYQK